jgi:4-alpha-glucanotransferase
MNLPLNKLIGTSMPIASLRTKESNESLDHGTLVDAFIWLEWLAKTKQRAWQVLPLSQTHLEPGTTKRHAQSPYKGYGIGLDPRYLDGPWATTKPTPTELDSFRKREKAWLKDYVLFCAIRDRVGTDDWTSWPTELRQREPEALDAWATDNAAVISDLETEQWRLDHGFRRLRQRADALGIEIIGDLAYYLPLQSPLVWTNQTSFNISPNGSMRQVSGIPDGRKAAFGRQVWGHPLYRWDTPSQAGNPLDIWNIRLAAAANIHQSVRVDHIKGLYRYGVIDLDDTRRDHLATGPGLDALVALRSEATKLNLRLIGENLGGNTAAPRTDMERLGIPGIRVLCFAYNFRQNETNLFFADVHRYPENCYACTTSHDTETLIEFVLRLSENQAMHLCEHLQISYSDDKELLSNRMRQRLIDSPAKYVIIPLQDWFLWPDRINVPGTETPTDDPNWRWRMPVPVEELPTDIYSHPTADR